MWLRTNIDRLLQEKLSGSPAAEAVTEAPDAPVEEDEPHEEAPEEPAGKKRATVQPMYPYGTVLWAKMQCAPLDCRAAPAPPVYCPLQRTCVLPWRHQRVERGGKFLPPPPTMYLTLPWRSVSDVASNGRSWQQEQDSGRVLREWRDLRPVLRDRGPRILSQI